MSNERENEWVLVPREPTSEMMDRGVNARSEGSGMFGIYRAMLAAAPSPPADAATPLADWDAALYAMFRALVDAGGAHTVARHGAMPRAEALAAALQRGMLAIERRFHPERFDEDELTAQAAAPAPVALPGSLDDLMKQVAETFPIAAIVRALDNAAPRFRGVLKPMKAAPAPGVGEAVRFVKWHPTHGYRWSDTFSEDIGGDAGWSCVALYTAPPAPQGVAVADNGTPGPWYVRKRERDGELLDCFVSAPDHNGFAYDAEILGDDEYRDDIERKLADCELIVAAVNARREHFARPVPGCNCGARAEGDADQTMHSHDCSIYSRPESDAAIAAQAGEKS